MKMRNHLSRLFFGLSLALGTAALAAQDYNNDGYDDLAIGIPNATVSGRTEAGAVIVIFGSATGLSYSAMMEIHQSSGGPGVAQAGDHFGASIASGDFNGDGFDDLAVGIPDEDKAVTDDGAVQIYYGSIFGPSPATSELFWEDKIGISTSEDYDRFGWSLAAGDFDGDAHDDLVIGVPQEDVGALSDAGAVIVMFGSSSGLTTSGAMTFDQDTPGVGGAAEAGDQFGYAVAAGNLDGDTGNHDDIAIGVPLENISGVSDCGAFHVLFGSATGPSTVGDQFLHRGVIGVAGSLGAGDQLGFSLAVGDFDQDVYGCDDLAIGAPYDDHAGIVDAGSVQVMYGYYSGLQTNGDQVWHQGSTGVIGAPEDYDHFGFALAAGDFNDDGDDDLAVGVPDEDRGGDIDCGTVHILTGGGSGLTSSGTTMWDQADLQGTRESDDHFGSTLTAGNFGNGDADDLVVGAPQEDIGIMSNAGAVHAVYGTSSGLSATDNQIWHRDSGLPGVAVAGEQLGRALGVAP